MMISEVVLKAKRAIVTFKAPLFSSLDHIEVHYVFKDNSMLGELVKEGNEKDKERFIMHLRYAAEELLVPLCKGSDTRFPQLDYDSLSDFVYRFIEKKGH